MKKFILLLGIIFLAPFLVTGQGVIESFDEAPADTSHWIFETGASADSLKGYTHLTYVTDTLQVGSGALKVDWSVHNSEGYGGYSKFEHWHPDSNGVYDFSAYDTLTIWYYNAIPQSITGRVNLRIEFYDVSNSPNGNNTYDVADLEFYYSFHWILDNGPGWTQIKMPMISDPNAWSGEAFNRTGWVGIPGNDQLDLDKIKGYSFEFSISGAGEGDYAEGKIFFDDFALCGQTSVAMIFFNGRDIQGGVTLEPGWGGGSYEVTDEEAATPGTNSIKWNTPPNDWAVWDGLVFVSNDPKNLGFSWITDSVRLKIKADAGLGPLKLVFADPDEDGEGADLEFEAGYMLEESAVGYDGTWKQVKVALKDFNRFDGGWDGTQMQPGEMDSTKVKKLKILIASTDGVGKVVYLDDIWTDNPEIDITPPDTVKNFAAVPVAVNNYNIITWSDFAEEDEENESYLVYASAGPITDLEDPAVDHLGAFPKGEQTTIHYLKYPLQDKEVSFYYAIQCKDAAGNIGPLSPAGPVTNTAKGIATISLEPPAGFAADGDITEWENSSIMPFVLKKSTAYVSRGEITDDADLTGTIYLAADDNFLYVGVNVLDDDYTFGTGNWWEQDAFELFIGLYDWRGAKHTTFKRDDEPDYKIVLKEDEMAREPTWKKLSDPGTEFYQFQNWGGGEYSYEAKISLDSLKLDDDNRFTPVRGMRIPMEITLHDNDFGTSEGNLVTSPTNTDNAHQTPTVWSYTWIGDTTDVATDIGDEELSPVITTYDLKQNYPNPFNPLTAIEYSIAKASLVQIDVYNLLGQKIQTLINKKQGAGHYTIQFDGRNFASGVYFYRIKADDFTQVKKMLLVK